MALTSKSDGLGAPNLFTATWVNDFMNLLTGVMNDQPTTLNYRPGSGSTPVLTIKSDGRPLIRGFQSDNTTQAFNLGTSGDLTLASSAKINPPSVPGTTTSYMLAQVGADSTGRVSLGIRADGAGNLRFGNNGTAYATEVYTDGSKLKISTALDVNGAITGTSLAVTGAATSATFTLLRARAKGSGANAGVNIWICPSGTDPLVADGLTDGDLVFSY